MSLRLVILHKMDLSVLFLLLVLLGLVLGEAAQVSVDQFLDQQEANLRELLKEVQANALQSCDDLLSTCNAESTCSRLTCPLKTANTADHGCQKVLLNSNCNGNCTWRNFDFSRSALRVPGVNAGTINSITPRQLQAICAQKNLDTLFKRYSNNTNFFRPYFGSVDGTFRIFPGMDESDCGNFDPRLRLWYLESTTNVKKAVMVVIDSGSSMTDTIKGDSKSNLGFAFGITDSFLNTTTHFDYVNILTYDNNVNFSSPQPVLVTNTSSHPDFAVFKAMLSSPNQRSVPPGKGNMTDAISKVITSPAGFGSAKITSEYLKVIILITDSNEQTIDTINNAALPWDLIKNNSISVFLFVIHPGSTTIDGSPLVRQLCDTRGFFKVLDNTDLGNPLLALEAYYSFVANIHATYVENSIDYSIEYKDFSDVDNKTFILSKAVFNSNRELLGVAAIDIYKTKLPDKITEIDIENAVGSRIKFRNIDFNSSKINNTTSCLSQVSNTTCNPAVQASNVVCLSNPDTGNTTLRKLSCCGACADAVDKPRNSHLALGLGLGLGIPTALILVGALLVWLFKGGCRQNPDIFEYPGGSDEDTRYRAD